MRAPKSLAGRLPKAKELKSNKLSDVQDFFERVIDEVDRGYKLLFQDIATIQLDADGYLYFGNKDTLGTWRIGRDGADYVLEHQTTTLGTWVRVDTAKGS